MSHHMLGKAVLSHSLIMLLQIKSIILILFLLFPIQFSRLSLRIIAAELLPYRVENEGLRIDSDIFLGFCVFFSLDWDNYSHQVL